MPGIDSDREDRMSNTLLSTRHVPSLMQTISRYRGAHCGWELQNTPVECRQHCRRRRVEVEFTLQTRHEEEPLALGIELETTDYSREPLVVCLRVGLGHFGGERGVLSAWRPHQTRAAGGGDPLRRNVECGGGREGHLGQQREQVGL